MTSEYRQSGLIWLGITRTVDLQKHGNGRTGYTKGTKFLDQKKHYQLLLLHGFSQVKKANLSCAQRNLIQMYLGHVY